jgi:hypothetical protein
MYKTLTWIFTITLGSLLACGCGSDDGTGGGRSAENLVDPSDPNALSEVLVIPGAQRVQGSPPQGSDDPSAPAIGGGGQIEIISGDQAVLEVIYESPSGYVDCYVQVAGADDYFVISAPSGITSGTIRIPVNIPEGVDSGAFDLYTCIAGQNGAVSNAINTNVGVTYSGGGGGGGGSVICASSDPSVGTLLPCGGGTQMLDFCIDQSSGACYYAVGSQQVSCGNCGNGGDITTIQACAERAVALCF